MKKNHNITILLTIYNRLEYTKKWIDFAEQQKVPFNIFISDGGNIENIKNKLDLDSRKLKIIYHKFKFYKNYKNIYEKYFYAINKIKTKYVIIAEDDDYINVEGFIKSAIFLKKNKDYSSVKGINCLGELMVNNGKLLSLALRNENAENREVSLRQQNSEDRLVSYFKSSPISIFNGLNTVKSLKKVFKILGTKDFLNLYITELILVLILINEGKIKREKYIDYIKMDNDQFSSSRNFANFRPFSKIIKSNAFHKENNLIFKYLKFKNKKKLEQFKNNYNLLITKDTSARLKEEVEYNSSKRSIKKLCKYFLIKINVYYLLKYLYLFLQSEKKINSNIILLNKSLAKSVYLNSKIFLSIFSFNKDNF